jgi:hypothetical protein
MGCSRKALPRRVGRRAKSENLRTQHKPEPDGEIVKQGTGIAAPRWPHDLDADAVRFATRELCAMTLAEGFPGRDVIMRLST